MFWFWRAVIAVGVGSLVAFAGLHASGLLSQWMGRVAITFAGMVFVLPQILTATVYGLLTRRYYRAKGQDEETRCRKCSYILRGLTEPRCPECGEAI